MSDPAQDIGRLFARLNLEISPPILSFFEEPTEDGLDVVRVPM